MGDEKKGGENENEQLSKFRSASSESRDPPPEYLTFDDLTVDQRYQEARELVEAGSDYKILSVLSDLRSINTSSATASSPPRDIIF